MNNRKLVSEKILDSLKGIYSFSLARTSSSVEAEDLSQQIVAEMLASCDGLKDNNAFYGWMWRIAKNTYSKFLRQKRRSDSFLVDVDVCVCESDMNVERDIVFKEDINILRRELSILSRQYREVVVKYYIEEKNCSRIAKELSVGVETVKQLLFKARKILKEGINMKNDNVSLCREYGEKSYNPDIFRFNMMVSDGAWEKYNRLFKEFETRRLPGNILLSTYYSPMSVEELSVELGVSAPYIEDELNIMLRSGLIKLLPKARYQSDIFIYTSSCKSEVVEKSRKVLKATAQKVKSGVDKILSVFKGMVFKDRDISQNTLKGFVTHFLLWLADGKAREVACQSPELPLGGKGYLWGQNYDYEKGGFLGIYNSMTSKRYGGWIHASNYRMFESCQPRIGYLKEDFDNMLAVANQDFGSLLPDEIAELIQRGVVEKDGDKFKLMCPVITEEQYCRLREQCLSFADEIAELLKEVVDVAATIMENHAPVAVKDFCAAVALLNSNSMAEIMECLVADGYLIVPKSDRMYTAFVVI